MFSVKYDEALYLVDRTRINSVFYNVDLCWKLAVNYPECWRVYIVILVKDVQIDGVGECHIVQFHLRLVLYLDVVPTFGDDKISKFLNFFSGVGKVVILPEYDGRDLVPLITVGW